MAKELRLGSALVNTLKKTSAIYLQRTLNVP